MNTLQDPQVHRDTLLVQALRGARPEPLALAMVGRFPALRALDRLRLLLVAPRSVDLLQLSQYDLEQTIGRPLRKTRWSPRDLEREAIRDLRWLNQEERHLLWIGDRRYPASLRRVHDAPPVLYAWGGNTRIFDDLGLSSTRGSAVAMVGTRRPDGDGEVAALQLGAAAAGVGYPLISGLALGIDAAIHRGAVAAGYADRAVAVLGSGIDSVFPRSNRGLAASILDDGGLIVSEYPPGTAPAKYQYPARNRIIAGMAECLVLFQAPERSGALMTVDYALDIGMPVAVHSSGASWAGGRSILQQGAPRVETVDDLESLMRSSGLRTCAAAESGRSLSGEVPTGRSLVDVSTREKLARFGAIVPPQSVHAWRGQLQRSSEVTP